MLYLGRNRLKEAEKAFQRVLALNPRSADAHNNLALLYGRQGKLSAALSHLKEAMQLDPYNPLYRSNFADLARSQRR